MAIINRQLAEIFKDISRLLEIKGEKQAFRIQAYKKAAVFLENLGQDVSDIYKEKKLKGLEALPKIGKGMAQKIEEYLQKGKIKYYDELQNETAIRQLITCFFETKGLGLAALKQSARAQKIIYSRYTKPAKQLLELAGSMEKAKRAIKTVAGWALSRNLDYSIETIFKKWLELDQLKPKEIVKKPFYDNMPMMWSENKKKWYVISPSGEWLEFADKEEKIEWRIAQ
ncbi:MAG: hypothetical protein M1127_02880 [Patescibacteria group bacterium]|nr:hypothetical protein [Patescibacteria group bacterium]